jgi:BACON domain-containing protein/fibronectin type III domain protein
MVFCLPLLTGCGAGGGSATDQAIASPGNGNGNAYGLGKDSTISLSPTGLAFSATQGGSDPAAQTVTISNSGTGTLNWSVSTTAGWLSLSSVSGTAPASFTVTAITPGLAAGTYSTTITVTGVGATNTPQTIPVDLTVAASTSSTSTSTSSTSTSTSTSSTSSSTTSTSTSTITTASASLSWNPDTDPSVVGYYVHYGLQSPNSAGSCTYTQSTYYSLASLSNKLSPTVTVSGLATGTTYYFAVSAYNGVESACSNEASKAT